MYKILRADLARLRRDTMFWSCLLAAVVPALGSLYSACRQYANGYEVRFDEYYFGTLPFLCLLVAVAVSFFLGTEYSDGTIRNKLIVGHTRAGLYAAHLLASTLVSLFITAAALLAGLAGLPLLGPFRLPPSAVAVYIALALLSSAAVAALCTLVGMLSANKAGTVALSMLLCLGLILFGSYFYNALCEPEMTSGVMMTIDGVQPLPPEPNPNYVGGMLRTVYELVLNALPTGQTILMANLEIAHPVFNAASSALLFAGCSLAGIALFRKKDLK